jgi:hypothetical protein
VRSCASSRRGAQLGAARLGGDAPGSVVPATYLDARWLPDGRSVAVDAFGMPVYERQRYGLPRDAACTAAALSFDGRLLALAYQATTEHGWLVLDLSPQKEPERRSGTPRTCVLSAERRRSDPATMARP